MTTNDYTYPLGLFLLGLSKQDAGKLSEPNNLVGEINSLLQV
jgi:hypothetical protein